MSTLPPEFIGCTPCLRKVCSNRTRILQSRPFTLLRKTALLPVLMKVFAPLASVLAKVFPTRLKNLEVVNLPGTEL